jgi:ribonuclease R
MRKRKSSKASETGTRFGLGLIACGCKLAEANPLTGALKFEPEDSAGGRIEPRGRPLPLKQKGNHLAGKRGRPGNIRHQGRRK